MAIRTDNYLREVALTLAQVRAVYLHEVAFEEHKISRRWLASSVRTDAVDLDDAGIGVLALGGDRYDFVPGLDLNDAGAQSCYDTVAEWQVQAMSAIANSAVNIKTLAKRSGLSRQSLYRIRAEKRHGLQYLYTLRGSPLLFYRGTPLGPQFKLAIKDLHAFGLMQELPE